MELGVSRDDNSGHGRLVQRLEPFGVAGPTSATRERRTAGRQSPVRRGLAVPAMCIVPRKGALVGLHRIGVCAAASGLGQKRCLPAALVARRLPRRRSRRCNWSRPSPHWQGRGHRSPSDCRANARRCWAAARTAKTARAPFARCPSRTAPVRAARRRRRGRAPRASRRLLRRGARRRSPPPGDAIPGVRRTAAQSRAATTIAPLGRRASTTPCAPRFGGTCTSSTECSTGFGCIFDTNGAGTCQLTFCGDHCAS